MLFGFYCGIGAIIVIAIIGTICATIWDKQSESNKSDSGK